MRSRPGAADVEHERCGDPTVESRLSPMEAIMWKAGQDPALRMTVALVMVLDHAPSSEVLAERFSSVIKRSPRLQLRPAEPSLTQACPLWIEDDAPDAEHHLRTAALGRPGSRRQLLELVRLLESVPFDSDHAPWDATLIEGLEGGRAALYLRAHHVVTDGLAGLRLVRRFLDGDEIDAPEVAPSASERGANVSAFDLTKALRPFQAAVNAVGDLRTLDGIVRGVQNVVDLAASVSRQVVVAGGSLSPLLVDRSATNRFEVISIPGARRAARALGGSRNDLLVAGAASGLGLYHERLGVPCAELRVASPTAARRGRDAGGNGFTPARVTVPIEAATAKANFDVVADRLTQARVEPALRFAETFASTINYLPAQMLIPALRAQAGTVDFAATVVPGLGGSKRICGARVEAMYPFGPRLGCPVNLSAIAGRDRLDVGIALDPVAISEPAVFLECVEEGFAALMT